MTQLRQILLAVGITACQACNPLKQLWAPKVHHFVPDALPAGFPAQIVVTLHGGNPMVAGPSAAGLTLWAANGSQVADISCELTKESSPYAIGDLPDVTCKTPALAAGTYSARFSSDRTCGAKSYAPMGSIDLIEPAHVTGASPSHGPEKSTASIKISGSNFGGPRMFCEYTFVSAPGAKFGCSMDEASYPTAEVTATSVVCQLPAWPGPMMQDHGSEGMKPVDGAVCSRDVHIRITNDARVHSQEPLVFHYDEAEQILV